VKIESRHIELLIGTPPTLLLWLTRQNAGFLRR